MWGINHVHSPGVSETLELKHHSLRCTITLRELEWSQEEWTTVLERARASDLQKAHHLVLSLSLTLFDASTNLPSGNTILIKQKSNGSAESKAMFDDSIELCAATFENLFIIAEVVGNLETKNGLVTVCTYGCGFGMIPLAVPDRGLGAKSGKRPKREFKRSCAIRRGTPRSLFASDGHSRDVMGTYDGASIKYVLRYQSVNDGPGGQTLPMHLYGTAQLRLMDGREAPTYGSEAGNARAKNCQEVTHLFVDEVRLSFPRLRHVEKALCSELRNQAKLEANIVGWYATVALASDLYRAEAQNVKLIVDKDTQSLRGSKKIRLPLVLADSYNDILVVLLGSIRLRNIPRVKKQKDMDQREVKMQRIQVAIGAFVFSGMDSYVREKPVSSRAPLCDLKYLRGLVNTHCYIDYSSFTVGNESSFALVTCRASTEKTAPKCATNISKTDPEKQTLPKAVSFAKPMLDLHSAECELYEHGGKAMPVTSVMDAPGIVGDQFSDLDDKISQLRPLSRQLRMKFARMGIPDVLKTISLDMDGENQLDTLPQYGYKQHELLVNLFGFHAVSNTGETSTPPFGNRIYFTCQFYDCQSVRTPAVQLVSNERHRRSSNTAGGKIICNEKGKCGILISFMVDTDWDSDSTLDAEFRLERFMERNNLEIFIWDACTQMICGIARIPLHYFRLQSDTSHGGSLEAEVFRYENENSALLGHLQLLLLHTGLGEKKKYPTDMKDNLCISQSRPITLAADPWGGPSVNRGLAFSGKGVQDSHQLAGGMDGLRNPNWSERNGTGYVCHDVKEGPIPSADKTLLSLSDVNSMLLACESGSVAPDHCEICSAPRFQYDAHLRYILEGKLDKDAVERSVAQEASTHSLGLRAPESSNGNSVAVHGVGNSDMCKVDQVSEHDLEAIISYLVKARCVNCRSSNENGDPDKVHDVRKSTSVDDGEDLAQSTKSTSSISAQAHGKGAEMEDNIDESAGDSTEIARKSLSSKRKSFREGFVDGVKDNNGEDQQRNSSEYPTTAAGILATKTATSTSSESPLIASGTSTTVSTLASDIDGTTCNLVASADRDMNLKRRDGVLPGNILHTCCVGSGTLSPTDLLILCEKEPRLIPLLPQFHKSQAGQTFDRLEVKALIEFLHGLKKMRSDDSTVSSTKVKTLTTAETPFSMRDSGVMVGNETSFREIQTKKTRQGLSSNSADNICQERVSPSPSIALTEPERKVQEAILSCEFAPRMSGVHILRQNAEQKGGRVCRHVVLAFLTSMGIRLEVPRTLSPATTAPRVETSLRQHRLVSTMKTNRGYRWARSREQDFSRLHRSAIPRCVPGESQLQGYRSPAMVRKSLETSDRKLNVVAGYLRAARTQTIKVCPSLGETVLVELPLHNDSAEPQLLRLMPSSTRVSFVRQIVEHSPTFHDNGITYGQFDENNEILVEAGEHLAVFVRYRHADDTPVTKYNRHLMESKVSVSVIDCGTEVERNRLDIRICPRPFVVHREIHLVQTQGEIGRHLFRAFKPGKDGRHIAVICSNTRAFARASWTSAIDGMEVLLSLRISEPNYPATRIFYIQIYEDEALTRLWQVWRIRLRSARKLDVMTATGQRVQRSIFVEGGVSQKVVDIATSSPEMCWVVPQKPLVLAPNSINKIGLNFFSPSTKTSRVLVNIVDRQSLEVLHTYVVFLHVSLPAEDYQVRLGVHSGSIERKEIRIPNAMGRSMTFALRSSHPEVMQIEPAFQQREAMEEIQGTLTFKLPKEEISEDLFLFVNDEADQTLMAVRLICTA